LSAEEKEKYKQFKYAYYESYPESKAPVVGRYWTEEQLNSGCGGVTSMGKALAETYARDNTFYGGTFCVNCGKHIRVEEFVWINPDGSESNEVVGS
jgi:hypothetical protein